MKKPGGGGPWFVLGLVSAAAAGAIVYVHYDQKKQRTDMRKLINEEKERERQEALEAQAAQDAQGGGAAVIGEGKDKHIRIGAKKLAHHESQASI